MKKYNILNNYNEDTELPIYMSSFEDGEEELKKQENLKEKEKFKIIINSLMIPNLKKINFMREMQLYLILSLFFIIALINLFWGKRIGNFIAVTFLLYITTCVTSKLCELPNTRYTNIATWNLSNSIKMTFKSIFPELMQKFDYINFISFSNIMYIALLIIAIIPSYSYLILISLTILLISYLYSFSNQDLEPIKDSLKTLNNLSFIILITTAIIGSVFYGSDALNLVGYLTWLILYALNHLIQHYEFKEV